MVVIKFKDGLEPWQKSLTHSQAGKTQEFDGDGEFTVTDPEWAFVFEKMELFELLRVEPDPPSSPDEAGTTADATADATVDAVNDEMPTEATVAEPVTDELPAKSKRKNANA